MAKELKRDFNLPLIETYCLSEECENKLHTLSLILEEQERLAKRAARKSGAREMFARFDFLSVPLNEEQIALLPEKLITPSNKMIYDYQGWQCGLALITEKLKSCIENIEPSGGHQFIPVEIFNADSKKLGDAYFWRILNVIDSIRLDSGGIKPVSGLEITPDSRLTFSYEGSINIYADRVVGKAAWHEMRMGIIKIVSDELYGIIKEKNLSNVNMITIQTFVEK
ncbi:hypothetical protein RN22_04545 [Grimontia sp. AD028]|uniref:imm11 family protein n=1 Tax=Grimontia sp. AD028 TaxID=1581149 RepID=UPI00061B1376|nr:DUF1629 domain-containing protein [Grimontia sp. AD028]KKD61630.1 hypothetical protein RN22_04545 [Grimontia sp. AD028]